MSDINRVSLVDRLNRALSAWKQMRPAKHFGGLSSEEFEMELQKAALARTQLADAEKQYYQYKAQRELADKHIRCVLQRVVSSIKGDPADGPESDLYRACGYVTPGERRRPSRSRRLLAVSVASVEPVPTHVAA